MGDTASADSAEKLRATLRRLERGPFVRWVPEDDHLTTLHRMQSDQDWDDFVKFYTTPDRHKPGVDPEIRPDSPQLRRIVELAIDHGVSDVLVETRYIDRDWRSIHAAYHSTAYSRRPNVAHRAHFFACEVPESLDVSGLQEHYIGYTVLRPLASAPVGRTMIRPPSALADGFRVEATEKVDVLGRPLTITAMPFMSQDGQYLRCAHASAWMLLQQAHLAFGHPRRLPAEVHDAMMGGDVIDRQLPSEGLSPGQLLGGLTTLGLSPKRTQLPATSEGNEALDHSSLFASLCRHVNTNLPPIVMGGEHSWLVVGYAEKASLHSARVTLYTHDDAAGPYLPVETPWPREVAKAEQTPKAADRSRDEPTAATTDRHWQEKRCWRCRRSST